VQLNLHDLLFFYGEIMADNDAFVPEDLEIVEEPIIQDELEVLNLADDEELVEKVLEHVDYYYTKYQADRDELKDLWEVADYMFKTGQNASLAETERKRLDRQDDSLTQTKAQKCGSTLFYRQVVSIASYLVSVLNSKKDPFTFKSRYNPEIFESYEQADELANQHNLLMRWTRDADGFDTMAIDLLFQLIKYGNLPIYMSWKRKSSDILDRYSNGKLERRRILTDNRPTLSWILNENFYADQNIGNIQDQNLILVKSLANIATLYQGKREGEYMNVDNIDKANLYQGSDDDFRETKEDNAGYGSNTSDSNTGLLLQFDVHALLPIDPTKPKGKRWDEEKFEPKKYWVTIVTDSDPSKGICLRIERNRDPDDEYPFEMLNSIPDDTDKLYGLSLAQVLRGNYTEATVAKEQYIDQKTLATNKPLMMKRGEVYCDDGELKYEQDRIYNVENKDSISEFQMAPVNEPLAFLNYIDGDSDEAAFSNAVFRGEAMGGRTSSSEAVNALDSSTRPHAMMAKYVLHKLLKFYAKKGVRYWHVYGDENQVLQISDETLHPVIRPAELFGDFNVELTIVDEYEQNIMQQQSYTFAAQNIIPMFQQFLDMRGIAKDVFEKILHWDVTRYILPDIKDESINRARIAINSMMNEGVYIPPRPSDDLEAVLLEAKGERIEYRGVEDEYPNVALLDRYIAEVEQLKEQKQTQAPQPVAPSGNETPGEVVGNQIAAEQGEVLGPQ